MHDGLPPPIPPPSASPAFNLGQAPDRAHFLYGLSCVSMGIATAAGFLAAYLHEWQPSEAAFMMVLAVMAGTASLTAFIFGMFAYYAREEDRAAAAGAQQALVSRIQDLEDEVDSSFDKGHRKGVEEAVATIEQAEQARLAQWTPDAIAAHVVVKVNFVAIIDREKDTGKPVVLIEWLIICGAHVPCDVFLTGGTCAMFALQGPPGDSICRISLAGVIASFDGKLEPGGVVMRKHSTAELSEKDVAALHSRLSVVSAARCLLEIQGIVKTPGGNCPLDLSAEQPVVEFRPWLREDGS